MSARVRPAFLLALSLASALVSMPALAQQKYWYDAGVRRALWHEPALASGAPAGKSAPAPGDAAATLSKRMPPPAADVYRDGASRGAPKRALGGGVLIRLRPGTSPSARAALFARHGIAEARPVGAQPDTWFASGPAGDASLELANRLHESGDFAWAAPNWWKERRTK